ncbi:MAG: endonuclease III, partial [Myxococcota bacterium]
MGGKARSLSPHAPHRAAPHRPGHERVAPAAQYRAISETLQEMWPRARCELRHESPYQLLCVTMLSAQSTDRRINQLSPALFEHYPDAHELARADLSELEGLIRSSGFYRVKARNLCDMA